MEVICKYCGKPFSPHPAAVVQISCGSHDCKKAKKRQWQKEKLRNDPDYRRNQAAAQKSWRGRNPHYMRDYRKRNLAYVDRNRASQRNRNYKHRAFSQSNIETSHPTSVIVKMDDLQASLVRESIVFKAVLITPNEIAKMDGLHLLLVPASEGFPGHSIYNQNDCKESTGWTPF